MHGGEGEEGEKEERGERGCNGPAGSGGDKGRPGRGDCSIFKRTKLLNLARQISGQASLRSYKITNTSRTPIEHIPLRAASKLKISSIRTQQTSNKVNMRHSYPNDEDEDY